MAGSLAERRAATSPGTMSLAGHLSELRIRLIRSLVWVSFGFFLAFWQWQPIFYWLKAPLDAAIALLPEGMIVGFATTQTQGGIIQIFRVATAGGLVIATPLVLGEIWGFIAPGLTRTERRFAGPLLPVAGILFFCGCAFAYYIIFPPMVAFMLDYNALVVTIQPIDIGQYLALLTNIMLAMGVAFEIPVLTFLLARLGLVQASILSKYRRHAIVAIALLAAVITPTPDAFNMGLMALPLYLLYEISVVVAYLSGRPRKVQPADPTGSQT